MAIPSAMPLMYACAEVQVSISQNCGLNMCMTKRTCPGCAAADDASSQQSGSRDGGYQSDFKRGKRLRKLARLLSNKQAQKVRSPP